MRKHLSDKPKEAGEMLQLILGNLKSSDKNLWFNTSLTLGKSYLDGREHDSLEKLINELKDFLKDPENPNQYDVNRGGMVLEMLALEIQMCIDTR